MPSNFKNSETRENLMRSFAGESQARNRYSFGASFAKKEKLPVIQAIFTFTAAQEEQHAKIFYNHLKDSAGETIFIDGGYPVDIYDNVSDLLKAAQHNEYEEHDPIYKKFGDIAKDEGFSAIASSFHMIAEIEKTHGDRFGRFADLIKENKLFVSDVETGWICLKCGYVHHGTEAPKVCPVCRHEQGYFIRLELCPFEGKI